MQLQVIEKDFYVWNWLDIENDLGIGTSLRSSAANVTLVLLENN